MGVPVKENMARAVLVSLEGEIDEGLEGALRNVDEVTRALMASLAKSGARAYHKALIELGAFEK